MGKTIAFLDFLKSAHGRVALAAALSAGPVAALMVANARVIDELRPRVLAAREAVLGREDAHLRDQLESRAGVYSERRSAGGQAGGARNLFAGIGQEDARR